MIPDISLVPWLSGLREGLCQREIDPGSGRGGIVAMGIVVGNVRIACVFCQGDLGTDRNQAGWATYACLFLTSFVCFALYLRARATHSL